MKPRLARAETADPAGIAVDGEGNLYVSDMKQHRIHKLSATGEPLAQFGEKGSAPGQLTDPVGLAVDAGGQPLRGR